jgi:hypothetical protein
VTTNDFVFPSRTAFSVSRPSAEPSRKSTALADTNARATSTGLPERPVARKPPRLKSDCTVPKRFQRTEVAPSALAADFCAAVGATVPAR